jgi:2-oxoglutarate dehydrogenase E1 component
VNGDDPEAVVFAATMATEFRQEFGNDVVVDVFCYRRYGHNEGDEPFFTQPIMYRAISEHLTPMNVYANALCSEGVLSEDDFEAMKHNFRSFLEDELEASKTYKPIDADWLGGSWEGLDDGRATIFQKAKTGVAEKTLQEIGQALVTVPAEHNVHPKIERLLKTKQKMFETGQGFDWATAEALAFGSLLREGYPIRMSGQDSIRGTFSQRHSGLVDQQNESRYFPLKNLSKDQANLEIIDSNLSEFAVVGFEYGYSLAEPNTLVLWEAQFGDFSNGAQTIIDQFISSGERKWLRLSGLVMLLPHGYEGQGPEHSSARLERYLQLCAEDNMQVANCTTPANYFHILRRQMHRSFRKPLVIMTPKSLLRHPLCVSDLADFSSKSHFQHIIPETEKLVSDDKVSRVVLCSGKVYYDLLQERTKRKIKDVALVRVEQYHPFPEDDIKAELKRYKNAEVVWCQEEPENMGAWHFIDRRIEKALAEVNVKSKRPRYVGRAAAAAPAAGYMKIFQQQQDALVDEALK